jgi:two-component system alkaline phosphatase synthesis response regulator PhoP
MTESLKVLLVEDETHLGETLCNYLKSKNFQVEWAESLASAMEKFKSLKPYVVLMDIGLPDGSGMNLAQTLRNIRKDFVLLFLSAQNDPALRLQGLEIGAEDYITKPFELKELLLRLERILSTKVILEKNPDEISFGKLKFWPKQFQVMDASQKIIDLGQKENAILELLLRKTPEVISRDQIINEVWGEESFPTNRTVDNYIVKLRKWAESDKSMPLRISSVRGIGYKLEIANNV